MVIIISLKDSKATHRARVHDSFIRDEKNSILSWDKQIMKAKDFAHDIYGSSVNKVELIKD